ncbi:hypothetical protein J3459_013768 [Metarhizium acridum]|uniref:uncharacterized protein n=1 Tax=Metarhizium acridum TaxID=92637 RepID=UPI001C6BD23D|nr:hypothetical protein J3458_013139 [Metarhizium acridum]KAG8416107.1 hypothetical protein J3459_013768 [Metarhizium acridum]
MLEFQCAGSILSIFKAQGWYGLISDVYILAIPLWLVWDLNLPLKRKAAVLGVFSTGLAACAISAASLAQRQKLVGHDANRTWENYLYAYELHDSLSSSCSYPKQHIH